MIHDSFARAPDARRRRATRAVARWVMALSMAAALVAVAGAFLMMQPSPRADAGLELPVRAEAELAADASLEQALAALRAAAPVARARNRRSTAPVWMLAQVPPAPAGMPDALYIADRHLQTVRVWLLDAAGQPVGRVEASRGGSRGGAPPLEPEAGGFALRLDRLAVRPAAVLVRLTALGAGSFSIARTDVAALQERQARDQRAAGLLAGAFGVLALFAAVVAWHSASRVLALFSPWLVSAYAITAITLGHDYLLLGSWPGELVESRAKQAILAAYALATAALFIALFKRKLARIGWLRVLHRGQQACAVALGLALVSPTAVFLPAFHLAVGAGLVLLVVAQARMLRQRPTARLGWYATAWAVQIVAVGFELVYANGWLPRMPWVSFESSVLAGVLLNGLALAETLGQQQRQRRRAQREAQASARHFRETYESAPGAMLRLAGDGTVLELNGLARRWLGEQARVGASFERLVGAQQAERVLAAIRSSAGLSTEIVQPGPGRGDGDGDDDGDGNGGDPRPSRTLALEARVRRDGIGIVLTDVSARVELARTLERQSRCDALTGLLNRRGLEREHAAQVPALAAGVPASLAHVDLARFRLVNDMFGAGTGDALLQQVAQRLREAAPAGAALARRGNDEFVALLPSLAAEPARRAVEAMVQAVAGAPYELGGRVLDVAAWAGVVELDAAMDAQDALACAERACAEAKRAGAAPVVAYGRAGGSLQAYREETRLAQALRSGRIREDLALHAQPVVGLRHAGAALEVLLRVRGADGRLEAPRRVIEAAERNGEMASIDRFVLAGTLEHLSAHPVHAAGLDFVAVNLSGASLNDARFLADARAMLAEHRGASRRVLLEITESVALYDIARTRRFIESMRALDVRIALDDFGAGYTSFGYLKEIEAQVLKLDGAFVRELTAHRADRAIAGTILALAHQLGMQTVAEWIEDRATLEALAAMGCDYGQGWLIARPQPLAHWVGQPPAAMNGLASPSVPGFASAAQSEPRSPLESEPPSPAQSEPPSAPARPVLVAG